jgi:carbonic anhydrase
MKNLMLLQFAVAAAYKSASGSLYGTYLLAKEEAPEFSYIGEKGPEFWGDLKPEWKACKIGTMQSPVDINSVARNDFVSTHNASLELNWSTIPSGELIFEHGMALKLKIDNSLVSYF